ncbi:hypothetical protein G3N55_05145 [Dissulfurirhabdus thermomarina]|uniref:TNase-like domain-containing protein n=1 Tax=Dissulfurirhabdus thermomarina TaxID=1765737 RepID=A0A6N9TMF6_DISTH|nr:thermonuclease family protein [Dissulfurirhabdus thermomarina]NDY42228.1 hypothetical protein [Dissulfurirhabdus thermomarina]NMX23154.1 hypothetical protein [Dissulfurirhabdus thermomarina]
MRPFRGHSRIRGGGLYGCLAALALAAAFLCGAGCGPEAPAGQECRVTWVYDGDTIRLRTGEHVRYIGIDAPEVAHDDRPGDPLGTEAARRNRELVAGKTVRLEWDRERHDVHGRLLAYVWLPDGRMVEEILVEEGLARACAVPPNTAHFDEIVAAQRRAMAARRGLWALPPPVPERFYIGNRRSLRFHRPDCRYGRRTRRENRVRFESREEALRQGYCPCRRCRP